MAVRMIHFGIALRSTQEIVDADLSDYFNRIPHGDLIRCVSRSIADVGRLAGIKQWLTGSGVPNAARAGNAAFSETKNKGLGTPPGGIISPLLHNPSFGVLFWLGSNSALPIGSMPKW